MRALAGYRAILVALIAVGILSIVIANAMVPDEAVQAIFNALGGATVGASISMLLANQGRDVRNKSVIRLLENTLSDGVLVANDSIHPFREVYHHYFVTKVRGRTIWRHRVFNFSESAVHGKLLANIHAYDSLKNKREFKVEGGYSGDRLFLFCKSTENIDSDAIEIFPEATQHLDGCYYGIGVEKTWDGEQFIYPSVLSRVPLTQATKKVRPRAVNLTSDVDEDEWGGLERLWEANFQDRYVVLPSTLSGTSRISAVAGAVMPASKASKP